MSGAGFGIDVMNAVLPCTVFIGIGEALTFEVSFKLPA